MKSWRSDKMLYVSVTRANASGSKTLTTPQQLASRRAVTRRVQGLRRPDAAAFARLAPQGAYRQSRSKSVPAISRRWRCDQRRTRCARVPGLSGDRQCTRRRRILSNSHEQPI